MSNVSAADAHDVPVIEPGQTCTSVTNQVLGMIFRPTPKWWYAGLSVSLPLLGLLGVAIFWLVYKGIGIWGVNQPVAWGFDIIHFVWWIGIGHAGTLISAILFLMRQTWRTAIARFAEAMTIFAVACAGLYPVFHTGRPWLAYWLFPLPNSMGMWPQFRSPLMFDVFAISTYASVSIVFWYVGLIPDLATVRDRATSKVGRTLAGVLSLGWRGSAKHWQNYEAAYLLLAGLSTPLVVSVHTIVSYDFALSMLPGWHATIFPPYFVAGAIYAGFAMVLLLMLPLRKLYNLYSLITAKHLDNMAKVMLVAGLIVTYGYLVEVFMAWYSQSPMEMFMMKNRMFGPYGWSYWALILCNGVIPQVLWSPKARQSIFWLVVVSISISIGMWLERFVIVVTSLYRDFMPSAWGMYYPTVWDVATYLGTFGLFFTAMFMFIRFVPAIAIFEIRTLLPEAHAGHGEGGH